MLCGRADVDPERAFTGRLTALTIFDNALSPAQVVSLHGQGVGGLTNVSESCEDATAPLPPSPPPAPASTNVVCNKGCMKYTCYG